MVRQNHDSLHRYWSDCIATTAGTRLRTRSLSLLPVLVLITALLAPAIAGAEPDTDSLSATVDRTSMYESETLTLTVKGETRLELSLDSLMNLRSLDLPEPKLNDLRVAFDVLDQRQSYSLRSINGNHSAAITWTYQLAPRQSGELTIPAIQFKDARSEPLTVEVKPGSPSQADAPDRPAWVEASINKDTAFLKEQLVLSLRLYYRGSLVGGDLTEPQLEDAILEPLGDQTQRSEYINGQRYQMVERRYLVYPQRSGELIIESQQFTGRQRDPVTGALRFLRAQSQPLRVTVKLPPSDFPGDVWIAAESLVLDESWNRPPEPVRVGDSLTRVLTIRTLGLLKSALPVLEVDYPEQFKAYPEGPRSEAEINAGTIEASQSQTTALVAVRPGKVTLPETRLHWWDTLNEQARVAVIPARTLEILPAPGAIEPSSGPASQQQPDSRATDATAPAGTGAEPESDTNPFSFWMTALAVFFALAWLVTLLLWLRWRKSPARAAGNTEAPASPAVDFPTLRQHAENGHAETLQELPAWVRGAFNRPDIHTLKDTRNFFADPELDRALTELEKHHFGQEQPREWQYGQMLAGVLDRLRKTRRPGKAGPHALPPFRKLPS